MTVSKEQMFMDACCRNPLFWRKTLTVDGTPWGELMSPLQVQDFEAIDPALLYLSGHSQLKPRIQRFYYQRSRGYSKTMDIASSALWTFSFGMRPLRGLVTAEDREQAGYIRDAIEKLMMENPYLSKLVTMQKADLVNKRTGAFMRISSSDVASSFGATPDFVICDEFTHWTSKEFWNSVVSSFAKKADKGAILILGCNAGEGMDWKWDVRETARTSPLWYFSSPPGASPWYTQEMLNEQRGMLGDFDYRRLFENEWQMDGRTFITLSEAKACIDPSLKPKIEPEEHVAFYVAAMDYAEKHDRTAACLSHYEDGQMVIDRLDVVDPKHTPEGTTRVSWCEEWLEEILNVFGTGTSSSGFDRMLYLVIDPHQLLWLIQKFEGNYGNLLIQRFHFQGGKGNHELATNLRQMLVNKQIRWFPGCGEILDDEGNPITPLGVRDDLATELAELKVRESQNHQIRIDHNPGKHDDRAFVVGACAHFIASNILLDTTPTA